MNKLPHHFWFKTVFVSSFSFQPVKSFSSEKTSSTSYVDAEAYWMETVERACVFKKSADTFTYINSLGSVCGHLRLISKYVT